MTAVEMVWLDLETTGLDYDEGVEVPLELGIVLTNKAGIEIDQFSTLIMDPRWPDRLDRAAPVVRDMHRASGLDLELRAEWMRTAMHSDERMNYSLAGVEQRALKFLMAFGIEAYSMPTAGSTVSFDRAFMKTHLPNLNRYFSHRVIDVSSIKELCKMHAPKTYEVYQQMYGNAKKHHRAIDDIRASIQEYQFYKRNFFDASAN